MEDVDPNHGARHVQLNSFNYSNGDRAIRSLGVPMVSETMSLMDITEMPLNLIFAVKRGQDSDLRYAFVNEQYSNRGMRPLDHYHLKIIMLISYKNLSHMDFAQSCG